jgi:hypothetical protein
MTSRLNVWPWALLFFFVAFGAKNAPAQAIESVPEQRDRLAMDREEASRYFDSLDAQCKKQFAVSGCLKDVNRQRLARLSAIKKAEIRLQDTERLQRGEAQRQQLEERIIEREQETRDRTGTAPTIREPDAKTPVVAGDRLPAQPKSSKPAVIDAAQQRENRNAYAVKQFNADKKRTERDQRLREQKKPKQGLPAAP